MFRTTFTILGLVLLTAIPDSANAQSDANIQQPALQHSLDLTGLSLAVAELRAENATYSLQLLDPLLALAAVQEETGDNQGAVTTLLEALYISRANFGLFDEAQVGILDRLISIQQREQNWEEVDELYATMEQVYLELIKSGREFPDAGLDKIVAWHLYAFREGVDRHPLYHIEKAGNIMRKQLELANSTGADAAQTSYLAGGIAAIDQFLQWNRIQRWNEVGSASITTPVQPYEHE
jgi:hypothetical protein